MYNLTSKCQLRVASLEQNMHKLWVEAQKFKHFDENQVLQDVFFICCVLLLHFCLSCVFNLFCICMKMLITCFSFWCWIGFQVLWVYMCKFVSQVLLFQDALTFPPTIVFCVIHNKQWCNITIHVPSPRAWAIHEDVIKMLSQGQ